jgi:hypothetical protein
MMALMRLTVITIILVVVTAADDGDRWRWQRPWTTASVAAGITWSPGRVSDCPAAAEILKPQHFLVNAHIAHAWPQGGA